MLLNKRSIPRGEAGFTLIELLVTMLIVTVGLLGLAKLQATAVSNTSVARTRALMTYQAESLAGMIRANRAFWVTTGAGPFPTFNVTTAGAASDSTSSGSGSLMVKLGSSGTCISVTCNEKNLAWDDMYTWAAKFNDGTSASAFPNASANIVCVPLAGSGTACGANPTTPHSYDITLTWQQKLVAINRSTASTLMTQPVSLVMHVQP